MAALPAARSGRAPLVMTGADPRMTHRFPSLFRRLGELQAQRPWLFVALAILSLLPAGFAAKGIGFKSDFASPPDIST